MVSVSNMTDLIKKIALEVVETSNPVKIVFGTMLSTSPLKIKIDQKLTLGSTNLIIPKSVSDDPLVTGDSVIMIRMQGGQQYVVIDKAVM